MKVKMTYWADKIGGKVEELEIDLKPFGYRMAPIAQWKHLVAAENKEVEKGKPVVVKVRSFDLPNDTMVGPLHIMRHALGAVFDVVECGIPTKIEEEKCVNQVLFIPIDNGEIKEGDLIGILKVFFIKTGLLSRLFNIGLPKVEIKEEFSVASLTWRDNGNIYREKIRTRAFGYIRSHISVWEVLVADEDVEVKAGEVVRVKIKEINLPPNTIVVPLGVIRNAYGTVIDVIQLGKLSRVEDEKRIQQAIFLPIEDGKIEKGDLLGVINVYYVGVKDAKTVLVEKEAQKVNMVYRTKEGIKKKEIICEPFGYKRSPIARWECLIADENKKVEYGKPEIIKVKKIEVPKNTIIYPLSIMRHAYGAVVDLFCDYPWRVEEGGEISKVIYLPIMDGEVKEGELLGVLNFYSVEVGKLEKIKDWLSKWEMTEEEIMAYAQGWE